ncbi:MAG: adenosylcobinamide-GDP ribazoletransferase, partial [Alphaproteobacteria bacterium]|nr:adenosylcobinamide-GDP ribazoletransferase [Alphaproteobacteria bacterium]
MMMLGDFHHAAVFLTRLPLPHLRDPARPLAACMWAFPLVGAVLGLTAGACFAGLASLLPPLPAALVALALLVLATGGLHEDGLADLADGFGGGRDRDHRLEIMRDSRTGSYGALAVGFSLALRAAALAALPPVAA